MYAHYTARDYSKKFGFSEADSPLLLAAQIARGYSDLDVEEGKWPWVTEYRAYDADDNEYELDVKELQAMVDCMLRGGVDSSMSISDMQKEWGTV